jgi:hypothetical protein
MMPSSMVIVHAGGEIHRPILGFLLGVLRAPASLPGNVRDELDKGK